MSKKYKCFLTFVTIILFVLAGFNAWAGSDNKRTVSTKEIVGGAENFLLTHLDWDPQTMDIAVTYKGKDLLLPPGELSFDYGTLNNSRRVGRIPLIVQVKVDNKFFKRLRMNAKVSVLQDVIRTISSVERGNIISDSDVVIENIRTDRLLKNIPDKLNKVIGQEATRNLQTGEILKFRDFKRVPLVERGSRVIIQATKGTVKITAPGVVREKGFKNSIVQVVNLETKKTLFAEVLDANTVEVKF